MKKMFMLAMAFIGLCASAQVNYPYKRPELLKGKQVKVKPFEKTFLKEGFTDFKTDEKLYNPYEPFPGGINYGETRPEALEGKVFTVSDVVKLEESYFGDKYRLTLKGEQGAPDLYYSYVVKAPPVSFPFEVIGGLTLPDDFFVDYIKAGTDTPTMKMYTLVDGYISINRTITNNAKKEPPTTALILIAAAKDNAPAKERGPVEILLEDGTSIKRASTIVMLKNSYYEGIVVLTKAEIEKLKTVKIKGYTVMGSYVFKRTERVLDPELSEIYRGVITFLDTFDQI